MPGILYHFEEILEAPHAPHILRRAAAFASDEYWVFRVCVPITDIADGDIVAPVVTEVIHIQEAIKVPRQNFLQTGAMGRLSNILSVKSNRRLEGWDPVSC